VNTDAPSHPSPANEMDSLKSTGYILIPSQPACHGLVTGSSAVFVFWKGRAKEWS